MAGEPTPLLAVMVLEKLPVAVAVPVSAPFVPMLRPSSGPGSLKVGAGNPVAVTVKFGELPNTRV